MDINSDIIKISKLKVTADWQVLKDVSNQSNKEGEVSVEETESGELD